MAALQSSGASSGLKFIVAPTAGASVSLRTAAAREGLALVNVEAVSVNGLALHVWRAMHPASAGRLVSRDELVLVLGHGLHRSSHPEAGLMRSSVDSLVQAIEADRMADRSSTWAADRARTGVQKVYAELFARYESFLAEHRRVDMADVYRLALESLPRFGKERTLDLLLVCRETELMPIQEELIAGLSVHAGTSALLGRPESSAPMPPRHAGSLFNEWTYPAAATPDAAGRPAILQAATRRDEVWMVLQDILERGIRFDEVELVLTDPDGYLPLVEGACSRLGIPATMRGSEEDRYRHLRSGLKDYLDWVASGYDPRHLIDLLRHPHLQLPSGLLSPDELAGLLGHFRLRPHSLSETNLLFILAEGARRSRIPRAQAEALVEWFSGFRKWVPDAAMTPYRFVEHVFGFLQTHFPDTPGADEEWAVLERGLSPLQDQALPPVESQWLAEWMLEKLRGEPVMGRDTGHGIHVTSLAQSGYGPRTYAWVLGLDDQAAGARNQDPAIHPMGFEGAFPSGYGEGVSTRSLVAERAARFPGNLTLSVPAWDVAASRSLFPSSALVEQSDVRELKPVHRSFGLDLADACRQDPWSADGGAFGPVLRGLDAERQRHAPEWTIHDGVVRGDGDGSALSVRMSPSRLETFLSCPYRFFLSEMLGMKPLESMEEEWIDRGVEGNILHDLFERHTRDRVAGRAGTSPADEEALLQSLRASLERQVVRSGQPVSALVEGRYRELAHGVRQYFHRERDLTGEREPVHAEYAFSDHEGSDAPAVRFQSGDRTLVLTGRIDRIDEDRDGRWIIVDYKSGKAEDFLPESLAKLDDKLQWALYAWAASRAGDKDVARAEYVFTSRKGAGWVSQIAAPADEQVEPLLESVLDRIGSGHFMPAPNPQSTCRWCDFKSVCGDLDARRRSIQDKFKESDPEETAAWEGWAFREKARK